MAKTTIEEKTKILSYEEAISALKIYRDFTKQVLPALKGSQKNIVSEYNKSMDEKLKKIEA